jgi:hypothetical protein
MLDEYDLLDIKVESEELTSAEHARLKNILRWITSGL